MFRLIKIWIEHFFNPLHVYCRLMDVGFSRKNAGRLSLLYEGIVKIIWKILR